MFVGKSKFGVFDKIDFELFERCYEDLYRGVQNKHSGLPINKM